MTRPPWEERAVFVQIEIAYDGADLVTKATASLQGPPGYHERTRYFADVDEAVGWARENAPRVYVQMGEEFVAGEGQPLRGARRWPPPREEIDAFIEAGREHERRIFGPPAPPGTTIEWRVRAEAYADFAEVRSGMRAFRAALRQRKEMVDLHVRIDEGQLRVRAAVRAPVGDRPGEWNRPANDVCRTAVAASLTAAGVKRPGVFTTAWPAAEV